MLIIQAMFTAVNLLAAGLFALAILHTFSTSFFEKLAHKKPKHAGIFHLLGEIEVVFLFWAMVMVCGLFILKGKADTLTYLEGLHFREPLFVFVMMVIAASKPVITAVNLLLKPLITFSPIRKSLTLYWVLLAVLPFIGSIITEPAAMTIAALLFSTLFFSQAVSQRFKYVTLAVLFVNISIGGTLTAFSAPPVVMVAGKWGWTSMYMLKHFGIKAAIAVFINATLATVVCRSELKRISVENDEQKKQEVSVPLHLVAVHVLCLAGVIFFAHHTVIFMGIFLLFLGVANAYTDYQSRLILKEGLMVACFLSGLVVLGGMQAWWLKPIISGLSHEVLFWGTIGLSAIADNAALTFLGSQVQNLTELQKHALVGAAVAGGGLTIIANAPNPAGVSILSKHFKDGAVNAGYLFLYALPPTLLAILFLK